MTTTQTTGRCLCGRVTWAFDGPANWSGHCHCESCRRQTSAPMTSFIGVPDKALRWTGVEPALYVSSPGVRRRFCGTCGSPMAYEADRFPDEVHVYAASLDDPASYQPSFHVFTAEQVPWLHLADDLVRHRHTTSGG